ncbi:hypothetical protein LTR24_009501 [Lithohypha guttulata]|uniref:Uncharacterized protein n=1 Tax=Lithohypha guttulata TaxID=1690604 RepID=A0ABR0JWZ7_9EURO|nr:hypothetical protein LTR24_009501 [Lithohypha guttulata]
MARREYQDSEGLQHVATERPKYPDREGMHVVQSNEKQVVPAPEKEAVYFSQHAVDRPQAGQSPSTRRYCGFSKRAFIILTLAVFLFVAGAAVGGGIGGSLASKSSSKEIAQTETSSSSSPSSSSGGAATVSTSSSPSAARTTIIGTSTESTANPTQTATTSEGTYNCPAQNDTTYTPSISPTAIYTIICDADQPKGVTAAYYGTVDDLNDGVVATSIEACIDACAGIAIGGGGCTAVTYGANITLALSRGRITGNCFLKNQRPETLTVDNSGQIVSAFLEPVG